MTSSLDQTASHHDQPGSGSDYSPTIDVALCRGEPSPPSKKPDMRQLTDRCELVFERMNNATACAKQLNNFYQKLSEIENSYSSALLKLAQSTQFSGSESLQTALCTLSVSVETRASIHANFANDLQHKLAKDMNELSNQMKKERAQTRNVWADSEKALKNQTAAVEKHFQRYLQSVRDGEKEVSMKNETLFSAVKNVVKQDKKIQEAIGRYRCRKDAYGEAVANHVKIRALYAKTCSYILANIEATDISRLHKMQSSLEFYYQKLKEVAEKNLPPVEMLRESVNAMDPVEDVMRFVDHNRTDVKDKLPPVMEFVEIRTDLEEDTPTKFSVSEAKSRSSGSEGSELNGTMKAYAITNSMGQLDLKPGLLLRKEADKDKDLFYLTLYEYSSDQHEVLSFVVGEFIRMEGDVPESDGWAWGLLNGNIGMFPTSYCQSFFPQKCLAICDFNLSNSELDQLRIRAGEPIWILHISDQHWVWAADSRGIQGNFPSSYCNPTPLSTDV